MKWCRTVAIVGGHGSGNDDPLPEFKPITPRRGQVWRGVSVRIPFTSSNLSAAGSIGAKAKVVQALPDYTRERIAGSQNLFNYSEGMTIGPAQGAGAPVVNLHLAAH